MLQDIHTQEARPAESGQNTGLYLLQGDGADLQRIQAGDAGVGDAVGGVRLLRAALGEAGGIGEFFGDGQGAGAGVDQQGGGLAVESGLDIEVAVAVTLEDQAAAGIGVHADADRAVLQNTADDGVEDGGNEEPEAGGGEGGFHSAA